MSPLEIQVKPYTPDLRAGLWKLLQSVTSVLQDDGSLAIRLGEAEKLMRCATSPHTKLTVAVLDDQIVGYAEEHVLGYQSTHLHRMATHRDFRNQGVFTAILEKITANADTRCIVGDINSSRRHYQTMKRLGFVPDNRPSREPGMIAIVRPARKGLARYLR